MQVKEQPNYDIVHPWGSWGFFYLKSEGDKNHDYPDEEGINKEAV